MAGSSHGGRPIDGPQNVVVAIPHEESPRPCASRVARATDPPPQYSSPSPPIPQPAAGSMGAAANPAALFDAGAPGGAGETAPEAGAGKEPDPDMFADADEQEEEQRRAQVAAAGASADGAGGRWDEVSDPSELGKRRRGSNDEHDADGRDAGRKESLSPADMFADADEQGLKESPPPSHIERRVRGRYQ